MSSENADAEERRYSPPTWETCTLILFVVFLLSLICYLLVRNEAFADGNLATIARVVVAVLAAGIGTFLPGQLHVSFSIGGLGLRATAAVGLAVLTYVYTPEIFTALQPSVPRGIVVPPNAYPGDELIPVADWPTDAQLDVPSRYPAEDVILSYRNDTADALRLFVYDFCAKRRSELSAQAPNAIERSTFWESWEFMPSDSFAVHSDLKKTNGWFAFVVATLDEQGQVQHYYLRTSNIFFSDSPALVVKATSDSKTPYRATFEVR